MKCLILHSERYQFTLDHPTPVADPYPPAEAQSSFTNALLVLAAAERNDSLLTVERAATELARLAHLAGADLLVINPFAHLSDALARPALAKQLTDALVEQVRAVSGKPSFGTPFGWYKQFSVDVYGHSNSQFFRQF